MKIIIAFTLACLLSQSFLIQHAVAQKATNTTEALIDTLTAIASRTDNHLFALSCHGIISVIQAESNLEPAEVTFLEEVYNEFMNTQERSVDIYPLKPKPFLNYPKQKYLT